MFSHLLSGRLFGVSPMDSVVFLTVPAVLVLQDAWPGPFPPGGPRTSTR